MAQIKSRQVIIAGAGIAGLTAALAFAARGFSVQIFERSRQLEDVGAGVQLSPNATRLLAPFGILDALQPTAIRPDAIELLDGRNLRPIGRVPLGSAGERRWGAPYLVVHRADLQSALVARAARDSDIKLTLGASVSDFAQHPHGVTASVDIDGRVVEAGGLLIVGADGVWSGLRRLAGPSSESKDTGRIAWRATIRADGDAGRQFSAIAHPGVVSAFLQSKIHLVAYPLRGGGAINLVAISSGTVPGQSWSERADPVLLKQAASGLAPALRTLIADAGTWTAWPIRTVPSHARWIAAGGIALIGDAAHAMAPYAAQGAAMAIEDAVTLADAVAAAPGDIGAALSGWEAARRPRIAHVSRRGNLNRFAWHASGPIALARNLYLRQRRPEKLAADLDWLYGWQP